MAASFDFSLRPDNCVLDLSAAPIVPRITNRPHDLSIVPQTRYAAPRKYVWVLRFTPSAPEGMPEGADEVVEMTKTHRDILPLIRFRPIQPPASSPGMGPAPYIRWDLSAEASILTTFWRYLSLPPEHFRRIHALMPRQRPVFVEAHNGQPLGRFIHELTIRRSRPVALFIQVFGTR